MMVGSWWVCISWLMALFHGTFSHPSHPRPQTPQLFASPQELRSYLDQINHYYAVATRPRFGKRVALSSPMTLRRDGESPLDSEMRQGPPEQEPLEMDDFYQLVATD